MLLQTSSPRRSAVVHEEKVHVFEDTGHVFGAPGLFIKALVLIKPAI